MFRLRHLLFPAFIILFLSCKNEHGYTYAIKDFRKSLQPYLIKIVSKGIVMYYDSSLRNMAADEELIHLSHSEHPVLRASAFREMLHRKSFNHFDILMNHLDDTAIVATDEGEFGTSYRAVSDDVLHKAGWKTRELKNKTVEQVLTKHNYLQSAYLILFQIEPQEKYYSFIKDMATRPRLLSEDGYELRFSDIEYALYGLAKFKKRDDVKIIKEQLLRNVWRLSDVSFQLMKKYPDTAYMDIFQTYHRKRFYRFSGENKYGFTGNDDNLSSSKDFIQALVVQQNDRSEKILDTILHRLPTLENVADKGMIEDELIEAIWKNPCPAYIELRGKIRSRAQRILKQQDTINLNGYNEQIDTTAERFRWYP